MVFFGHQATAFTLPRKVDEPFGGLLHTMVNIIFTVSCQITNRKTWSKVCFCFEIHHPGVNKELKFFEDIWHGFGDF